MIQNSKGFRIEGGETEREIHFQAVKMTKSPEKRAFWDPRRPIKTL